MARLPKPPRLIFFDLDDTLFDTSGQLVDPAHREAALAMVDAGLPMTPEEAFARRRALASLHPAESISSLVAQEAGTDASAVVAAGDRAFFERDPGPLELAPSIHAFLSGLKNKVSLYLVTSGHRGTQALKVKRLALSDYFRAISFVDPRFGRTKADVFEALLRQENCPPERCLVVGDRPDGEIQAGHALGCRTVRIHHGEHSTRPLGADTREADFNVQSIDEMMALVRDLIDE